VTKSSSGTDLRGKSRKAFLFWSSIYVAIELALVAKRPDNIFLEVVVRPGFSSLWQASELIVGARSVLCGAKPILL
jgi:hypothetical protein